MNNSLWQFVNYLLIIGIPTLAVLLAGLLWAEVKKFRQANPDTYFLVRDIVQTCVQAAEQAGLAELIEDKYDYALHMIELRLHEEGIRLDIEAIAAEVEAAVWELFNKNKES